MTLHWKPAHDFAGCWVGRTPEKVDDPSGWVEQVGVYYAAYVVTWNAAAGRPVKCGIGVFNTLQAAQAAVESAQEGAR
jgi:hypothetical protein